jgi:two-component system response regulator RegA
MNESQHEPTSILLVDDDEVLRGRIARALESRGFDVATAASYDEAIEQARTDSPELALVDLRMPGRSGLELVRDLRENDPATKIVVLTAYGSIATAVDAMRVGAAHYLTKPADVDDILAAFEKAGVPVTLPSSDELEAPSLARAEWEHIQRVLTDTDGNISETARRLGIHRRSLQRKLQKYPPSR